MSNIKPIFIGCLSKTGASLLRNLIGSHPNIFGGDGFETNWFSSQIIGEWKNADTIRQKWLREWYCISYDDYIHIQNRSNSGVNFFSNLMEFCAKREGKKRWLEKSPGNIKNLDLIKASWPQSKLVHSVRDLRDVFASWKYKSTGKLLKSDVNDFVFKVVESYDAIDGLLGSQTNSYLEVKYEDIVLNTERTLKEVFRFLEEDWIDGLHIYDGKVGELKKVQTIIGKNSNTSQSLTMPIFTDSIGHWKKLLSQEEINTIESELGEYQSTFGYAV